MKHKITTEWWRSYYGTMQSLFPWVWCTWNSNSLVTSVSHCFIRRFASVTECDLPPLLSAIWSIQWVLVHWSISSTQSSCNWILVECLKILSRKNGSFLKFRTKITQIYIQFYGEWALICRYKEIETCYTLETWDYYKDYICTHNAEKIKEISYKLTPEKGFDSLTSVTQWLVNDCSYHLFDL